MDLVSLDTQRAAEAGAWCNLRHPATNEPLKGDDGQPVAVLVVGTDSASFNQARNRIGNRRVKRGLDKLSLEEVEAENREMMAGCTLEFRNIVVDGQALKYSREAAVTLYTRFPWIYEQVNAFMADRANFLSASAKD